MSIINSKDKKPDWKLIEMKGIIYYCEKGFSILFKITDHYGYDFVIEKNGDFKRVNVKVAYLKTDKKNVWAISAPGSKDWLEKKYSEVLDIYLVWLPHKGKFIELDGTFLDGLRSKVRSIPPHMK
ncbi:group I intron-associated PD-(D/E)XK endonuclease [Niallia taxi]|uniref:group I intron-associated PD-(D/E)XK endonuclease n=1 Tax=Niallia taxi TaxID=2499688 RepID=UPI003D269C21